MLPRYLMDVDRDCKWRDGADTYTVRVIDTTTGATVWDSDKDAPDAESLTAIIDAAVNRITELDSNQQGAI